MVMFLIGNVLNFQVLEITYNISLYIFISRILLKFYQSIFRA